jgi:uncharacterized glyoxalase superfamily protein PhnB
MSDFEPGHSPGDSEIAATKNNPDDFDRDYEAYRARGVRIVRPPVEQPYGKFAVFEDVYGDLWDLIQFADGR